MKFVGNVSFLHYLLFDERFVTKKWEHLKELIIKINKNILAKSLKFGIKLKS